MMVVTQAVDGDEEKKGAGKEEEGVGTECLWAVTEERLSDQSL